MRQVLTTTALLMRNLALGDTGSYYPSTTQPTSTNTTAVALANAISNQAGIIDLRNGQIIELYEKPNTTLITSKGRNAADNADGEVQAYAWNVDAFNTSELTADGAAGYAVTFNDGFSGKNIARHISFDNAGRGLRFTQLTITAKNSAGDQDLTLLEQMEFTMLTYTVIGGREKPVVIDIASALRNTAQQSGLLTILLDGWVNSQTQWSWIVGSGATITVNVQWA